MAKSPTSRANFAANCVKLIETYDFDGIDIDWEYPGYAEHNGTPEDTQNYSLLLQEIRTALDALGKKNGRVYGLTAALPCGPDLVDNIQIDVVSKILSELNLMTYDFYG
jgi:chitinase